jgi:thiamine biosynthesis lipoprotein
MTSGSSGRPQVLTPRARRLLPLFLLVLLAFAVRQLWWLAPEEAVIGGPTMGTTWSVRLDSRGRTREDLVQAQAVIERSLAQVNRLMSTWQEESELSRFNRHASTEPFGVSAETFQVLELALQVGERSGGAFDVTVKPLVAAWGFGAGARAPGQGPDAAELAALRGRVGLDLLELDASKSTLRKRRPDVECDLSAIAKGFAVDQVVQALEALGWGAFLVEVGGEVGARGERPAGGPWRVGIERPDSLARAVHARVELFDQAMATSGDYRNFYEQDGKRLAHIIDPRSGRPVQHVLASVSVVHRRAVLADAWATALSVLGPEAGFALAEREGLAGYFLVRRQDGSLESRATRAYLALPGARTAPPHAE